jgi:hypothetical protein
MTKKQRPLDLRTLDDVADEVRRLRDGGYSPRGKWNLSQVCDHLTRTVRIGLDGDKPRFPWIARKLFAVVLRRSIRTRRMMAGASTAGYLLPADADADDPQKIDAFLAVLHEAKEFSGSLRNFPLMDGITPDTWRELQVVHCQHHLAFLWPE